MLSLSDGHSRPWNRNLKKLQEAFHLDDPRHALLELTKGKLTTDPRRHTGEGIFFTSRMFDRFMLASDKLTFCRFHEGDEWLFDVKEEQSAGPGTHVSMIVHLDSEQTPKAVFDRFTAEFDDFDLAKRTYRSNSQNMKAIIWYHDPRLSEF